jgi:hypothetical protein
MNSADINNLTIADLARLSDSDLDHLIDCQHQISGMGKSWGLALIAEADRRRAQRVADNQTADACIAALGERGAQSAQDPMGDSLALFS